MAWSYSMEGPSYVRMQQRRNTSEYWRSIPQFVPLDGEIIIYTDYQTPNGKAAQAIKIGDGKTAIASLPFITGNDDVSASILQELNAHTADTEAHVSEADRQKWNNKLNYRMEGESLIFTTD